MPDSAEATQFIRQTAEAALAQAETVLAKLLPGGRRDGHHWVALNPKRVDRHFGSFRINVRSGKWADFALADAKGGDFVALAAYLWDLSQFEAAKELAAMLGIEVPVQAVATAARPPAKRNSAPLASAPAAAPEKVVSISARRAEGAWCPTEAAPPAQYPYGKGLDAYVPSPWGPWVYKDADGRCGLAVYRFDRVDGNSDLPAKEYRQMTPRRQRNGEVAWTPKGIKKDDQDICLPPYGLHSLAGQDLVFFVEGEKACDALLGLGLAAIAAPSSALHGDLVDFACLAHKRIVLWPDGDQAGSQKAEASMTALTAGRHAPPACHIALLNPATLGLSGKEDAWEWVQRGGSAARLQELAAALPFRLCVRWSAQPLGASLTYLCDRNGFQVEELKTTREGPSVEQRQLSNFVAWIASSRLVSAANGDQRHEYEITGIHANGAPLPRVRVEAEQFRRMGWVNRWSHAQANIMPRAEAHLANAVAAIGPDLGLTRHLHIYEHTGWLKTTQGYTYLSVNANLGAAAPDIRCELSAQRQHLDSEQNSKRRAGQMDRYRLPQQPEPGKVIAGLEQSYELLTLAPPITAPLWSAIWLGLFASELPPPFVLFLAGSSGNYKSSLAGAACAHYGEFDYRHLPASFEGTAMSVQEAVAAACDALIVVDDFRSGGNPRESQEKQQLINFLSRSVGNAAGRSRLRSDGSRRPEYVPRSMTVVTGERWPFEIGESGMARMFGVTVTRDTLSEAQRALVRQWDYGVFRHFMADLISDMARQRDRWRDAYQTHLAAMLKEPPSHFGIPDDVQHGRLQSNPIWLLAGLDLGCALFAWKAHHTGICPVANPPADGNIEGWLAHFPGDWHGLRAAIIHSAADYAGISTNLSPGTIAMDTLRDLVAGGRVVTISRALVGQAASEVAADQLIGYHDQEHYYLLRAQTWQAIQDTLSRQGSRLMERDTVCFEEWMRAGWLQGDPTDQKPSSRYFISIRLPTGDRARVLQIRRSVIDN